ncbi:MAG: aromatic-ring-hydroxylating dioxygenase subunit beta [Candidatus Binataceae bacterium]
MVSLRERVEEFLFYEAKLIDEHLYDEWLGLWTEDGLYWVPCNTDDADPARQAMIIYDNRARLGERIYRLTSGAAWAQQPRSRTRRLISNVEVRQNEGGYMVESNCIIAELRRSKQDIFAARMLHTLRPVGESFQIALKKVLLLNNDEPIDNLTFLV